MNLTVNGKQLEQPDGVTGQALLAALDWTAATLVVEVNGDLVHKADFLTRELKAGDVVELVTLVGGG